MHTISRLQLPCARDSMLVQGPIGLTERPPWRLKISPTHPAQGRGGERIYVVEQCISGSGLSVLEGSLGDVGQASGAGPWFPGGDCYDCCVGVAGERGVG